MTVETRWEQAIRDAITSLEHTRGDWVALVDLRPILNHWGTSRAAQDRHLKRLSLEGKVHLVPESNRKALREEDHDASLRLGGDDNHLIAWNYHRHP
ncbi:hypothetical protein [Actinokineospora iranica]|uniref:Uncharacterized protein n=1 Tax=Actinokineospora iranica TaxID=1271860 RepID=A0A1G6YX79_9PSEU|nr:hypothetical protein [Actinokineospora iranica]SDD94911.1 hypothetical protein SAMN05216174_12420 [Actinokineospora iranica]